MHQALLILRRNFFLTSLAFILPFALSAQEGSDTSNIPMPELGPNDTIPVPAMIHGNQWIPGNNLEWFTVSARYPKHLLRKRQEWTRLRNAIYVTYPYAKKAGAIMNEMNVRLSTMKDDKKRKSYIKSREKELKKEFADPKQET